MSRISDLLNQLRVNEPELAQDIEREVAALADRRAFGLNFERHVPEAVELPGRKVRKGDKVRVLPARGAAPRKSDETTWCVTGIESDGTTKTARIVPRERSVVSQTEGRVETVVPVEDLVVIAEFRDPIYPGLVSTGNVRRGGDKPFHAVINAENYHALQTLLFTHRGRIDCIYIDPPYNTGARDWKYNNNYVEGDDLYRHSKWLAFMERRLLLAKELLREDGVLVCTIDENEEARLSLLFEQTFEDWAVTHVPIVHNPRGVQGDNFSYIHETALFVTPNGGNVLNKRWLTPAEVEAGASPLRNWGGESRREDAANCFYPIYVRDGKIVGFGDAVDRDRSIHPTRNERRPDGTITVWPIDSKGVERKWRYARQSVESVRNLLQAKTAQRGPEAGAVDILIAKTTGSYKTVWVDPRFDASTHGTQMIGNMLGRTFPYPKSLYAVEECLRAAVGHKQTALVLDFFAGSGTTAHAVMRLNRRDAGRRQAIVVTNNEVGADEQIRLRRQGHRPGDAEWERRGICDYITKPRIEVAVTGKTLEGQPIKGEYRFTDEFPMADGFEENVEFFTLTYEAPLRVSSNREFGKIAPLLWLRAGSKGRRIDDISTGWDVADAYGVLADLDHTEDLLKVVATKDGVVIVYIVTDEDRLFEAVAQELPDHVEPVRLYEAYLRNFEIESGRGSL